jgi:hypothetical protein
MVAISEVVISKRAIGFNPCFSLLVTTLSYLPDRAVYRSFLSFRAAGLPRSFDGFTIADGFQKTPKMHD